MSDSKLCNRDAMRYIDTNHGRFLAIMPNTRAEVGEFRRFIATHTVAWAEVLRRSGRRQGDPEEVFFAAPGPSPSVEGYRIVWIRSSAKEACDAESRRRAIEKARVATGGLDEKLAGPRCRLTDATAVEATARAAIEEAGASRWVDPVVSAQTTVRHKQQRPGRPGPNTAHLRIEEKRFAVRAVIADDVVGEDACFDGCWPMMTNDKEMTEAELLFAMKRQPGVENRHHVLKGVIDFVPVYPKSNQRIDAFAFLGYVAVLIHALIERDLRRAMRDQAIGEIPLYPERRACTAPTAARVIEVLEPLSTYELIAGDEVLKRYDPNLSSLQRQLLELLGVPKVAYATDRTTRTQFTRYRRVDLRKERQDAEVLVVALDDPGQLGGWIPQQLGGIPSEPRSRRPAPLAPDGLLDIDDPLEQHHGRPTRTGTRWSRARDGRVVPSW